MINRIKGARDRARSCASAAKVTSRVNDEKGRPAIGAFLARNAWYRISRSLFKHLDLDFFIQPRIYRSVGETVSLARGRCRFEFSSGVALWILGSSHSNPIFVIVDGNPIRGSRRSAKWCLDGVDVVWERKERFCAQAENAEAGASYEHPRELYRRIVAETVAD